MTAGRRRWWLAGIASILVLAGIGWFVHATVESHLETFVANGLKAFRTIKVATVRTWIRDELKRAQEVADQRSVREGTQDLLAIMAKPGADRETLMASQAYMRLRDLLETERTRSHHPGYGLFTLDGLTLLARQESHVGSLVKQEIGPVLEAIRNGRRFMSKPFRASVAFADAGGALRSNQPAMYSAAPIWSPRNQQVIGLFCFLIRPETRFTEILYEGQTGASGETYAFDERGLMLSKSRFDQQLRRIGLLKPDDPESGSVLTVHVRDPGGNLPEGFHADLPRSQQELTHMAQSAIGKAPGFDIQGYRDYRGVTVVGAWEWLDDCGFGIASEIDYDEAFGTLGALRSAYLLLFILLVLACVGLMFGAQVVQRMRRRYERTAGMLRELGQYRLEAKIGQGGMGEVYLARHAMLRRPTALKIMLPGRNSERDVSRFEREVQLTSMLTHPNTIAIYDYGRAANGVFYYAMEHLEGLPLNEVVQRSGPLSPGRTIRILEQVCGSLAEAHQQGLIHRDIKPSNIMLCTRGGVHDVVKVLDFGLVLDLYERDGDSLTLPDSVVGTPQYLPPEALQSDKEVDARSDLYSLGCVAYFLLTGRDVIEAQPGLGWVESLLNHDPIPPSSRIALPIPTDLENIVMACLERNPGDRPQSAKELRRDLSACGNAADWSEDAAQRWWEQFGPDDWMQRLRPVAEDDSTDRMDIRFDDRTL